MEFDGFHESICQDATVLLGDLDLSLVVLSLRYL
ncbi:hypothetical protein MARINON1_51108 [Marinobacter salarius]|nr:hypothetical protein MBHK15_130504 [Marinobacter salarius]VXB70995.1 hypothetical protein MARINON1_51108 [Marinobacter salarius]